MIFLFIPLLYCFSFIPYHAFYSVFALFSSLLPPQVLRLSNNRIASLSDAALLPPAQAMSEGLTALGATLQVLQARVCGQRWAEWGQSCMNHI